MNDYIRRAFKALEDFQVDIDPIPNVLAEAVDEEPLSDEMSIRELFEKEATYIITYPFKDSELGMDYSLFIEALNDGESCDIRFEEFNMENINEVLVEVLDSEHEFIGSLTGENIDLSTKLSEAISKAHNLIVGEEDEVEAPAEEEPEANEREFIEGAPEEKEVEAEETVDIVPEEEIEVEDEIKEESLKESKSFDVASKEEMEEAEDVLEKPEEEHIEQIVDASAESKEDLNKSYIGSVILQCPTCKSMMYKDPDQLVKVEGEEELYNIDEECPHCGAKDGFEVVGQVASLEVNPEATPVPPMAEEPKEEEEVKVEETPEEEKVEVEEKHEELEQEEGSEEKEEEEKKEPLNEEHCEIKLTTEEKNMLDKLTHKNKMDAWFAFGDDDETIVDLEDDSKPMDTCEAILLVADGTDNVEEFLDEEEVKLFKDLVSRCEECKGKVEESLEEEHHKESEENDGRISKKMLKDMNLDVDAIEQEIKETQPNLDELPETFEEKMDFLAADEDEAIEGYRKVLEMLGEEEAHVKEQLEKILEEEEAHKAFLDAVKKDHELVYSHEESNEEEKEPEEVEKEETVEISPEEIVLADETAEVAECKEGLKEELEPTIKTCEVTVESFDEGKFDSLVTKYLKENYSNVKAYKTTDAGIFKDTNRVVMEGIITFKSGKEKQTKFIFEAKEITNKNLLKLVGINEMFSKGKAFTLLGKVDNNKLLSESLAYRYKVDGKRISGKTESFRKR